MQSYSLARLSEGLGFLDESVCEYQSIRGQIGPFQLLRKPFYVASPAYGLGGQASEPHPTSNITILHAHSWIVLHGLRYPTVFTAPQILRSFQPAFCGQDSLKGLLVLIKQPHSHLRPR